MKPTDYFRKRHSLGEMRSAFRDGYVMAYQELSPSATEEQIDAALQRVIERLREDDAVAPIEEAVEAAIEEIVTEFGEDNED